MQNDLTFPNQKKLREAYDRHADARAGIKRDLEAQIEGAIRDLPSSPTVKSRTKDFTSYYKKYLRLLRQNQGNAKASSITDLIGIRIVCPFIEDIDRVQGAIQKNFEVLEVDHKGSGHSFKEFGYQSTHMLIRIPEAILKRQGPLDSRTAAGTSPALQNKAAGLVFDVAEIQIRTILQDAWAEVEHELVYKAEFVPLDDPMKHKLAAVNANLFLADIVFQEIRDYQRQLNGEMGKRRDSFFKKIEESTDALLFEERSSEMLPSTYSPPVDIKNGSMDDLLLNALYAHNKNQFPDAIRFYSRILEMGPDTSTSSLVLKHRGMAYFAQAHYQEAVEDFSRSLELDPASYKAAYYRGIIKVVLLQYPDAVEDFGLSLGINPYQPYCLYRRGQAYYHLEDYPQALADCEAALALEPNNETVERFRQLLLKKLKM